MTRFRDLDGDQKDAFKELLLRGIDRRIHEEIEYTNQVYRLLVLGNGAGIALLATFMGAVAATGNPFADLVAPLWKFFIGCVLAALIYAPLMAVSSQATNHIARQALAFFQNQIDIESLQGYGFNRLGLWVVRLLALASLSFFSWGVYQCIQILKSLQAHLTRCCSGPPTARFARFRRPLTAGVSRTGRRLTFPRFNHEARALTAR